MNDLQILTTLNLDTKQVSSELLGASDVTTTQAAPNTEHSTDLVGSAILFPATRPLPSGYLWFGEQFDTNRYAKLAEIYPTGILPTMPEVYGVFPGQPAESSTDSDADLFSGTIDGRAIVVSRAGNDLVIVADMSARVRERVSIIASNVNNSYTLTSLGGDRATPVGFFITDNTYRFTESSQERLQTVVIGDFFAVGGEYRVVIRDNLYIEREVVNGDYSESVTPTSIMFKYATFGG